MFSPISFIALFFFLPASLLIAVFLLSKNLKASPSASPYIVSALCAVVGIFLIVLTYNLFVKGEAILPVKNASSFTKQENPNAFFLLTGINIAIGIIFLLFAVRTTVKAVRSPTSNQK